MLNRPEKVPGSFRDPRGKVFRHNGSIYRTITDLAANDYEIIRGSDTVSRLVEQGKIVSATEVDQAELDIKQEAARYVVKHPRLPFISHPYEWPYPLLKAAALFHLDMHLELLSDGLTFSDASAYNVQFRGVHPVFIDFLSLRPYRDGEYWLGHRQFCEQFLNPLLMRALVGIPYNSWYRGSLEGIPSRDLRRMLPFHKKISWNVISQVLLQSHLQEMTADKPEKIVRRVENRQFSKRAFQALLAQLRGWIARLEPRDTGKTVWSDYAKNNTYTNDEARAKHQFVAEFSAAVKPGTVWDLGCNTGDFSKTVLQNGGQRAVCFDADHRALELLYTRAGSEDLEMLPLYLDGANASPNQGWRQRERQGLEQRADADGMLALAFEHHLAIGRNVPLPEVIEWLVGLAPCGVIEFVQKDDPTVQRMLSLREDIFDQYDEEIFETQLASRARIIKSASVSQSNRRLFWYSTS